MTNHHRSLSVFHPSATFQAMKNHECCIVLCCIHVIYLSIQKHQAINKVVNKVDRSGSCFFFAANANFPEITPSVTSFPACTTDNNINMLYPSLPFPSLPFYKQTQKSNPLLLPFHPLRMHTYLMKSSFSIPIHRPIQSQSNCSINFTTSPYLRTWCIR